MRETEGLTHRPNTNAMKDNDPAHAMRGTDKLHKKRNCCYFYSNILIKQKH